MSSSDDECIGSNHVFYKDRPEWQDVVPIPSDEGPVPVVSIDYSDQFADVYDYVRGVIKSGEKSPRVLSLTCDAISLNAANYTVWQLRRDVLEALGIPKVIDDNGLDREFDKEFTFCENMIENNQKNYQVWHHQKALVTWAVGYDEVAKTMMVSDKAQKDVIFEREMRLTKQILAFDAKNYHAWQHRQWILSVFGDFSTEMEYINGLLVEDVRNNSAWNQRHFVFVNLKDFSRESILSEMTTTWKFIKYAMANESPFSYLRGLVKLAGDTRIPLEKEIVTLSRKAMVEAQITSVPFFALFVEIVDDLLKHDEADAALYHEVNSLLQNLIEKLDPIREHYWKFVKIKFESTHSEKITKGETSQ